jgi:uncharacterized membrane protein
VIVLAAVYAAGFAWLSIARHRAFATGRFDLGNMVQAVWSTAHGHFLETTDLSGRQFSRLGTHVDPVLALFAPLLWVWPSPEVLLVAQAIGVALGALPVFWLGRRWLGDDRLAAAGAALYLLYPPMQYATLFDFHPVTLAAPLLLFCIWAAEEGRMWTLGVCAGLAALTQEQVGLALVMLAIWLAVRHPTRRRAATILGAASAAWVAIAAGLIIPLFSLDGGNPHIVRYEALGSSPGGIFFTIAAHPLTLVTTVATVDRAGYLVALLLPLLALPLRAPLLAAGAVPQLLMNLYATTGHAQSIDFHYTAVLVPFLLAASLLGLARLRMQPPRRLAPLLARPGAVAAVLVGVALLAGIRLGPLPWSTGIPLVGAPQSPHNAFTMSDHARALEGAVAMIPPDAAVSASNGPGGHLSARRRIFLFPLVADADWIVVTQPFASPDQEERRRTLRPKAQAAAFSQIKRSLGWRVVFSEEGVLVFRRIATARRAGTGGGT